MEGSERDRPHNDQQLEEVAEWVVDFMNEIEIIDTGYYWYLRPVINLKSKQAFLVEAHDAQDLADFLNG